MLREEIIRELNYFYARKDAGLTTLPGGPLTSAFEEDIKPIAGESLQSFQNRQLQETNRVRRIVRSYLAQRAAGRTIQH